MPWKEQSVGPGARLTLLATPGAPFFLQQGVGVRSGGVLFPPAGVQVAAFLQVAAGAQVAEAAVFVKENLRL